MKSPSIAEPMNVLKRYEIDSKKKFQKASAEFRTCHELEKAERDVLKGQLKKAIRNDHDFDHIRERIAEPMSPHPVRRRYLVNDSTVEKLGELLCENPNGLTVFRDELTGLLRSLDKDGNETARAFVLESWNGDGRFTYDRIGRGTIDIPACCVSVIGGIQPGPLSEYLDSAARGGKGDDGLMQRIQLGVYPDVGKEWRNVDRWPDSVAKNTALTMFDRLHDLEPVTLAADFDEYCDIPFLRFDEEAQEEFDEWRTVLEHRLRSGEERPTIESHLAKYRSLIPSLALLIHLADEPDGGPITNLALDKALRWARYLESHALRIYGVSVTSDLCGANELGSKILDGTLENNFSLRDVYRRGWSKLADQQTAKAAIEILGGCNWLIQYTKQTSGRTATRYRINPRLRESELGDRLIRG